MSATATVPERRAREYETIYIMRSNASTADAEKVQGRIGEVLEARGGKLLEVDNWGRRKLAYNIEKASRGVFVYLRFVGFEDLVVELERNLRLLDEVLRFQTVLISPRVDLQSYEVEPEHLDFGELDPSTDEEEPGLAQRLGLVERPRSDHDGDRGDGRRDDRGDRGDRGAAPADNAASADEAAPAGDEAAKPAETAEAPAAPAASDDAPAEENKS